MQFSKLVKVLKTFDRLGLIRLHKFVHSPYFAVYPPSIALFDYCFGLYPHYAAGKLSTVCIAQGREKLATPAQQHMACTRLLRAIEHFMALEEWEKNEPAVKRHELAGLKERLLMDEFDTGLEKEQMQLQLCAEQHVDTFFEKHMLTELSFNTFNAKLRRGSRNSIMPVVKTLDEFYAIKKLRYLCEAINRKQFLGAEFIYHEQHIPTLLKILEPYTNNKYPYVYLFVNVYHMMVAGTFEEREIPYRIIQQYASQQTGALPSGIIESIGYALNNSLYWNNKGYAEAGKEYLWWIDFKARHKLLLQNGKLLPALFRNIILAARSQEKPELMTEVIRVYAKHLPKEHVDTNIAFAQGLCHYSLQKFKEAVRFFWQAQARDEVIFNCLVRHWHWKSQYECDKHDTQTLLTLLDSFTRYLQRNKKELQHSSKTFERFIHYAGELLKALPGETLAAKLHELQSEEPFAGKSWIIEKLTAKNKSKKPLAISH